VIAGHSSVTEDDGHPAGTSILARMNPARSVVALTGLPITLAS
jgi:hypothetical protein